MSPLDLAHVLRQLPKMPPDPNLLVGTETMDDAGVYKLSDEVAIVQSVDFFTPVVDDPFTFGQIAAANALSDIYAMGAEPLTALNLVAFPGDSLDKSILAEILRGGMEKVKEAGAALVGGHTVDDPEPKYGLAVTGVVHPRRVLTNSGARSGDLLVLTKPIGVGVITTAMKWGEAGSDAAAAAIEAMATLNAGAAKLLKGYDAHACTDVTGFGLLGHLYEMLTGSGLAGRVWHERVPVIPGALELAEAGNVCGGSKSNMLYLKESVSWPDALSYAQRILLCDAITSGGLLVALPPGQAEEYAEELKEAGLAAAAVVGELFDGPPGRIEVA